MNNPDFVQYSIELNERRRDKTFRMHNVNTLLKVFFNKENEKSLWQNRLTKLLLLHFDDLLVFLLYTFTQNNLPVGLLITFDHLPSIPFFLPSCKIVSSQNMSYWMAGIWFGLCSNLRKGVLFLTGLHQMFVKF